MNLDSNDIEIEEVLYRYFRDDLSEQERTEVDTWKVASDENEATYNELRLLFLDLKGVSYYENMKSFDSAQSWEVFSKRNKVKSSRSYSYLMYAASIVVIVSAAIGLYINQDQPSEVSLATIEEVKDFKLSDGSEVSLNKGASLSYVEPFQNNERRVKLTGEGYFNIAKKPEKPFVVEVEDLEVRVLGTRFFINQPNENRIDVLVEEGKVLISYADHHEIVEAGGSLSVDRSSGDLSTVSEDETGVDTFWKNRKLVFNLTSIEEVVNRINQAYGSSIGIEGPTEGCSLTVIFDNESFDNVLEIIASTLDYEVVNNQSSIILKGNGCQ